MKRWTVAVSLVALLVGAGAMAMTQPARAATAVVQINCSLPGDKPVSGSVGDVLVFSYTGCATLVINGAPGDAFVEVLEPLPTVSTSFAYEQGFSLPSPNGSVSMRVLRSTASERGGIVANFKAPPNGGAFNPSVAVLAQHATGKPLVDTTTIRAEFVRSRSNCNTGTLTIHGLSARTRVGVTFEPDWDQPTRQWADLTSRGGSGPEWQRFVNWAKDVYTWEAGQTKKLPTRAFTARIIVWLPSEQQDYTLQDVPACRR